MDVATSTRRIDVIYLNDKGESLAEGEPHQSYTCITSRRGCQSRVWGWWRVGVWGGVSTGLYHRINTEIQTLEPLNTVGVRQQKGIWRYVKGDLLLQTFFFFLVYILL